MLLSRTAIRSKLILIATGLYIAGFIAGVAASRLAPRASETLYDQMVESFRNEFEGIDGSARIFSKILLHNLAICALMAFGGLVFAIPPVFILLVNGIPLGIILARSEKPILVFASSILPHGVFEFPATFLAASFGILLGRDAFSLIWNWMKGEGEAQTRIIVADLTRVLKSFVLVMILLAMAAAVETFLFIVYAE